MIGTANGARGLDAQPEVHYVPAETSEDFAAQIMRLMSDPASRAHLVAAGLALAAQHFLD